MREARDTLTELPPRRRDPSEPARRQPYVPEVPGPEGDAERGLERRLDEVTESLTEIRELLEEVLRELRAGG